MRDKTCPYCGNPFRPSVFHPDQRICGSVACQRRRRREYHKKRIAKDASYRALCADSQKYWREKHPEYPKAYRAARQSKNIGQEIGLTAVRAALDFVKNSLAKNNVAVTATRCTSIILSATGRPRSDSKNNVTPLQVVLIGDLKALGAV